MVETKPSLFPSFIENLRLSRNMSREEFLKDILSLRQYSRFLKGESEISNKKLLLMSDRLDLSIFHIYNAFYNSSDHEYNNIHEAYIYLADRHLDKATEKINLINRNDILSSYNKKFYDYVVLATAHRKGAKSPNDVISDLKSLINYSSINERETYSWLEIVILIEIAGVERREKRYTTLSVLEYCLSENKINFSDKSNYLLIPPLYSQVAAIYGNLKQYNKVITIADNGINYCRKYGILNSIAHLFFYKASAEYDLKKYDSAVASANLCMNALNVEGNIVKKEKFSKVFKEEFGDIINNLKND
ncbi:hypothetical protein CI105_05940 [Candidatus Izimaplasma bacterium ZiA1]|uniref:helix-turn-helix domain-containing protein n=1 Tax=Candidatus Izimoplasma sp. ZiA1 TaxID=2024899 RepID=UPI000BAA8452|nr:hypothetical protein CI105_05940 [Candidatus Izimaplasma bacterium ZiA1]